MKKALNQPLRPLPETLILGFAKSVRAIETCALGH